MFALIDLKTVSVFVASHPQTGRSLAHQSDRDRAEALMLDDWNVLSSSTAVCAWVEVLHDTQNPPPPLSPNVASIGGTPRGTSVSTRPTLTSQKTLPDRLLTKNVENFMLKPNPLPTSVSPGTRTEPFRHAPHGSAEEVTVGFTLTASMFVCVFRLHPLIHRTPRPNGSLLTY